MNLPTEDDQIVSKIDKEFVESIRQFEKVHKKYLNEDGSVNEDGYDLLHDAEVNWADDIKWNDYTKFHLQPRLENYWFEPKEDVNYKRHWIALHPKIAKEYDVEIEEEQK